MPPTFLKEGVVINTRYRVERFIGAGGFAAVYRAEDTDLHRPVAIKVLSALAATPDPDRYNDVMDRFKREARAMARIRHPNVVTIHDFGFFDELGLPFIVMELLEGHDLDEELKRHGPIDAPRALALIIDCLEALQIGHEQGVIHKDLKPSNLFVCHRGTRRETLRLLDFGIARLHEQNGRLTGTGQIMGTPQYLSPEYIREQEVTPALDVYQMGLLLVEALSARKVVGFDNALACAMAHREGNLPIPEALLRSALGPVVRRALALEPQKRYSDAGQFAQALAAIDPTAIPALDGELPTLSLKDLPEDFDARAHKDNDAPAERPTGMLSHDEIVKAISQRPTIRAERVQSPPPPSSGAQRRLALNRDGDHRGTPDGPPSGASPALLSFDEHEPTLAITPPSAQNTANTPASPLDDFSKPGGRTPSLPTDAALIKSGDHASMSAMRAAVPDERRLDPMDHEKTTVSGRHARIHRPKKPTSSSANLAPKRPTVRPTPPITYKSAESKPAAALPAPTPPPRSSPPTPTAPIAVSPRTTKAQSGSPKVKKAASTEIRQSDPKRPPMETRGPAPMRSPHGGEDEDHSGRRFWLVMALAAIVTTIILGTASVVALRWYLN